MRPQWKGLIKSRAATLAIEVVITLVARQRMTLRWVVSRAIATPRLHPEGLEAQAK